MLEMFNHLHSSNSKTEQDIFIQSMMELEPIIRTRPRKESSNSKPNDFNVKYNVQVRGKRTRVCKDGFKQAYG